MKIERGDIVRIEEHDYAVFFASEDILGLIRTDKVEFINYDTKLFLKEINSGKLSIAPKEKDTAYPNVPAEEMERVNKTVQVMNGLLKDFYPRWKSLAEPTLHNNVKEAASEIHCIPKSFKRLLYRYLRSGCDSFSLVDKRHMREANLKRQKENCKEIIDPATEPMLIYEKAMLFGLNEFLKKKNVLGAYNEMITKYFSDIVPVNKNGHVEGKVVPRPEAPSYHTLYRFITKNLGGKTVTEYVMGEKERINNGREKTGNQRSGLVTIGQAIQIDECKMPVDLTDAYGNVIGPAIVYGAFDPYAQIIIGLYIGFIDNYIGGVINVFLSMMEPHENQTSIVGVHCDDYSFPSMVIPHEVYDDHGPEYMSDMMIEAMRELGIKVVPVPVAAGSYKGGIENAFKRIQNRLIKLLINDGYILPTHEGPDEGRKNAVLNIDDFKAVIYRIVIELNTTKLGDEYSPDLDMMQNGIPPVPAEIWKYKKKTCFDPTMITEKNRMRKMFPFLWRNKTFEIGLDGITYKGHKLRYFVEKDWFIDMIHEKNPDVDIRYCDTDISQIYVKYKGEIQDPVPLAPSRDELRSFASKRMSWDAYELICKKYDKVIDEQEKKDEVTKLTTAYRNKKTLDTAKAANAGVVNNTKNITEARAAERARVESSPQEIRNRMLGIGVSENAVYEEPSGVVPDSTESDENNETANKVVQDFTADDLASFFEDEE